MDRKVYGQFEDWFKQYVHSFYSTDDDIQLHVKLKEDHTLRVCDNIGAIGQSLALSQAEMNLAKTVALFHDIGRFTQYQTYRTFNDARSADHAVLGVEILHRLKVLAQLIQQEQETVYQAVLYHNRRSLPENESADCLLYAKMIRDADKLDIFEMITTDDVNRQIVRSPEFNNSAEYSPAIVADILNNTLARFEHIRTTADQMLFRLSWLYNIYFNYSFRYIRQKGYLEKMYRFLPDNEDMKQVQRHLNQYLEWACAASVDR